MRATVAAAAALLATGLGLMGRAVLEWLPYLAVVAGVMAGGWLVSRCYAWPLGYLALLAGVWAISDPGDGFALAPVLLGVAALLFVGAARPARPTPAGLLWGGLALGCGMLVAHFSGGQGGAGGMVRFFMETFGWSLATAETVTIVVRKSIHFLFYGGFALFAALAVRAHGVDLRRAALFGLLWGLGHAGFDEGRQLFAPGRSPSVVDVLLDLSGMLCFLAPFWWKARQKRAAG